MLSLPRLADFPYYQIPDFWADLGRSSVITNNGAVILPYAQSYLTFPHFFILEAQLSEVLGLPLPITGGVLELVFGLLYPVILFSLFQGLFHDKKVTTAAVFLSLVTNAAITSLYAIPSFLGYMFYLILMYFTWTLVYSGKKQMATGICAGVFGLALAVGDPFYSFSCIAVGLTMLVLFSMSRNRVIARRLMRLLALTMIPTLAYALYLGSWTIASIPGMLSDFLRRAFETVLFQATNSGVGTSNPSLISDYLSASLFISKIVYVFVGTVSVIAIVSLIKRRQRRNAMGKTAAMFVLAIALSTLWLFGIGGTGYTALGGRFLQLSYPFLVVIAMYWLIPKLLALDWTAGKKGRLMMLVLVGLLVVAFAPVHVTAQSPVTRQISDSALFITEHNGGIYSPIYELRLFSALEFYTGQPWIAGPGHPGAPLYNNLADVPSSAFKGFSVVYDSESVQMGFLP